MKILFKPIRSFEAMRFTNLNWPLESHVWLGQWIEACVELVQRSRGFCVVATHSRLLLNHSSNTLIMSIYWGTYGGMVQGAVLSLRTCARERYKWLNKLNCLLIDRSTLFYYLILVFDDITEGCAHNGAIGQYIKGSYLFGQELDKIFMSQPVLLVMLNNCRGISQ